MDTAKSQQGVLPHAIFLLVLAHMSSGKELYTKNSAGCAVVVLVNFKSNINSD